jgi:hypothetical protein
VIASLSMPLWLHALLCVVVPCLFGLTMYFAFELWNRRRLRSSSDRELPVIDYLI